VSERDQNFRVAGDDGRGWVLKVSNSGEREAVIEMEVGVVRHIAAVDPTLPVALPHATRDGAPWAAAAGPGGTRHLVRLLPLMPGRNGAAAELSRDAIRDFGAVSARLGRATRGYFHRMAGRPILWDVKHLPTLRPHLPLIADAARALSRDPRPLRGGVLPPLAGFRAQVIHNDLTFDNALLDADGRVSGIVDFGDMAHTALVLDLVAALVALFGGRQDPADLFGVAEAALAGYAAVTPLEDAEAAVLGDVVLARLAQTTLISAWRVGIYPENAAYLSSWDAEAWPMLALFEAVGLEEVRRRFTAAARRVPAWPCPRSGARARRYADDRLTGPPASPGVGAVAALLRGAGPPRPRRGGRMYDPAGRAYLDAYNNVPVGATPTRGWWRAIARQAATLNTNTRYLHGTVLDLAERLVATMPPGLDTVMFVNSAARRTTSPGAWPSTATAGGAEIVTHWAYHGVSAAIADSPRRSGRAAGGGPRRDDAAARYLSAVGRRR